MPDLRKRESKVSPVDEGQDGLSVGKKSRREYAVPSARHHANYLVLQSAKLALMTRKQESCHSLLQPTIIANARLSLQRFGGGAIGIQGENPKH